MTSRTGRVVVALLGGAALSGGATAAAQDSQYGVRGLGTPGRWESVRARSTGGAFGPFDPLSPLMEAALADVGHLNAIGMAATSYRHADMAGSSAALRSTRFPLMQLGGPVTSRLVLAGGFTTYLDKSWDVTIDSAVVLRGTQQRYTDEITSDGSVADLRLAAASRVAPPLALGAGVHLLTGSTHATATRRFADTTYHNVQQAEVISYDGFGVSGSALVAVAPGLSVALWARSDNRLRATVGGTTTGESTLPRTAGGGVLLEPSASVRVAATAARRAWSRAGAGAFDTWSWSAGAELIARRAPIRVGVRGGQLPFGPGTTAPTEFAVAAGTGRTFSQGHALVDLGVERLTRTGSGFHERVWTVLVGMTLRP